MSSTDPARGLKYVGIYPNGPQAAIATSGLVFVGLTPFLIVMEDKIRVFVGYRELPSLPQSTWDPIVPSFADQTWLFNHDPTSPGPGRLGVIGPFTGPPPTGGPLAIPTGHSAGLFSLVEDFAKAAQDNPAGLREIVFDSILAVTIAAAALSVIPLENNFGGPLAAGLIRDLIRPFKSASYDGSISVALRPVYPTNDVRASQLVQGIEAGAISDDELHGELVRSGVRPEAAAIIGKVAVLKRFEVETKDDIALLRAYQHDINTSTIQILTDEAKTRLVELRATRKDLTAQYRLAVTKIA